LISGASVIRSPGYTPATRFGGAAEAGSGAISFFYLSDAMI